MVVKILCKILHIPPYVLPLMAMCLLPCPIVKEEKTIRTDPEQPEGAEILVPGSLRLNLVRQMMGHLEEMMPVLFQLIIQEVLI
ncbi:hypothetical protein ES705_41795 [subsurface metagenome]